MTLPRWLARFNRSVTNRILRAYGSGADRVRNVMADEVLHAEVTR